MDIWTTYKTALYGILQNSGFLGLTDKNIGMLLVAFVLLFLAIKKGFEPLLLLPIAFGCLLVNLPLSGIMGEVGPDNIHGGFLYWVSKGIEH